MDWLLSRLHRKAGAKPLGSMYFAGRIDYRMQHSGMSYHLSFALDCPLLSTANPLLYSFRIAQGLDFGQSASLDLGQNFMNAGSKGHGAPAIAL